MSLVNVTVLKPGPTVSSMTDEVADGKVAAAVDAAKAAYLPADSDGKVEVVDYPEDFDDAVAKAIEVAKGTNGRDLLVIVTDLECNDPARAESLLTDELGDDFVVIVPVSNQGYNKSWATKLDDDLSTSNQIDVVTVEGLGNRSTAFAEVDAWLAAA